MEVFQYLYAAVQLKRCSYLWGGWRICFRCPVVLCVDRVPCTASFISQQWREWSLAIRLALLVASPLQLAA